LLDWEKLKGKNSNIATAEQCETMFIARTVVHRMNILNLKGNFLKKLN